MDWSYEKLKAIYLLGVGYGTESPKIPYSIMVTANPNAANKS